MNNQKLQTLTRIAGISILFLVVILQQFKDQNYIPQQYLPYLFLLSLVLYGVSIFLKAKSGAFNQYHLPIIKILFFLVAIVIGVYLIYYFTT